MSTGDDTHHGIRILSFDNGGPGTYSQLLIVKEYMNRLAADLGVSEDDVYPADHFDLMGGVGFGGLVALMLGHLRMNVDEAIDGLLSVASAVFPEDSEQTSDPEANSRNLKKSIESLLRAREIPPDTKMNDRNRPPTRCKVILYAATTARIDYPQAFRTYPFRGPSINPTIVEAICATISIPLHFLPVKIGPRRGQENFIGSPLGTNNPTRELLKEAGTVFGDEKRVAQILSIGSGTPLTLSMDSGIDEANFLRLSKDIAIDCEAVAQELHTRLYNIDTYLRVNVNRGMQKISMTDWSELRDIESHTGAYIAVFSVSQSIDISLRHLRERYGAVTLGQVNQSSETRVRAKRVPAVSPYFVPRTGPWKKMVYHLVSSDSLRQKIFPITGMGGCGKTQMVSYFLQEYPSLYTRAAFVDASSLQSVQFDLEAWAQAFGDGHERDVWEDAIRLLSNIPVDERWILILDNADDPTLNLNPLIPKSRKLTIIITSRNRYLGALSTSYHLELGEMEEDEALATLLQAARRQLPLPIEEMKDARTLIKELGCLAVALAQAGTYCHQLSSKNHGVLHPYTFTKYLSLFYSHRPELMKKGQPFPLDHYQRGVYTTLDLSYQTLSEVNRKFLHFISFFHHVDIPLPALAAAAQKRFADTWSLLPRPEDHVHVVADLEVLLCADGEWNGLQVHETIRNLRSVSLISATSFDDRVFLQLHPLVQAWSRDTVSMTSHHYRAMAMQVLTSCTGPDGFPLYRYILPHILDILGQVNDQDIHVNDLMSMGEVLLDQGHYRKATELVELAVEKMMDCVGRHTEGTLMVTEKLATLYRKSGRFGEAERLQVGLLEQRRRALGLEHPDTIRAATGLASICRSQGRWSEAENLAVPALKLLRRVLGMEHPDAIRAAENLAATYSGRGRWGEAEKLQLQILEQRGKILGVEHPDTGSTAARLATTYCEQGRWKEAQTLQSATLGRMRRVLGGEHPRTLAVTKNLARTFSEQEMWEEAVGLQLELLEVKRRVLGDKHPSTMSAAAALASTYHFQGRLNEAEKLKLEVLHQRRIMGEKHPSTILASDSLTATRSLREESNFVRQSISTMFPHIIFTEEDSKRNQPLLVDIVEEPRLWYYETIPFSNPAGEGSIVHKGHSYCLPLVALNLQLSETSIMISKNSTFSRLSSQLYSAGGSALPVALEQTCGPYPRWRIPKNTAKVPRGLQKIYIADISKPFTLALVRDVGGDTPLLIDMSLLKRFGTKTVGDVIGDALDGKGRTWSSIKLFSGRDDIQGSSYAFIQKEIGEMYSTVFVVRMNDDPLAYSFRNEGECMAPLPLRIVFFQSQHLVDTAPRLKAFTLPAIHLSRALHHLVLSLSEAIATSRIEETMGDYFISRLNSLVSELKANFRKIEDLMETSERAVRQSLIQFFYELCEEQPGVVSVRQSFESFKAFILDGQRDSIELEYFPLNSQPFDQGDHLLIQAETSSIPPEGNGLTGSSDSSSSYDGESSAGSVEQLVEISEAVDNEQKVED